MTAEELAALGYRPDMGSPALTQYAAQVSPADLQQFYAQAGGVPSQELPVAGPQPQVDPAMLAQLMGTAPSPDQQMDVSANQLAMMANLGVPPSLPPSDPNGITSPQGESVSPDQMGTQTVPQPYAVEGPNGKPIVQSAPPQSAPAPQQPKLTPWQQYLTERGIGPQSVVDMATHRELLKGFNAVQLKQLEMNDPEKKLKLQKDQIEINKSSMEQADAVAKKEDAIPQVEENIKLLDDLTAHKGLSDAVGAKGASFLFGLKSAPMAGTDAANFMARIEQVQGKNFLAAFNQLKGAGQITEIEGAKAQAALGRLSTSQSEPEFRQSVAELRGVLQAGLDRSKARMAAGGSKNAQAPSPTPGANAPVIRTTPRGTFQSLGNGQWVQIK